MTKQELLKQFKAGKIIVKVKTEDEVFRVCKYLHDNLIYCLNIIGNKIVNSVYNRENVKNISADEFLGESMKEKNKLNVKQAAIEIKKKMLEEDLKELDFVIEKTERVKIESSKKLIDSVDKKIILLKELQEVNSELDKPKFNEPENKGYLLELSCLANGVGVVLDRCFLDTEEKYLRRAKEIKLFNLLNNFSLANGGFSICGDDLFDLFFGAIICSTRFKEVAEEARRRYKKELEELSK